MTEIDTQLLMGQLTVVKLNCIRLRSLGHETSTKHLPLRLSPGLCEFTTWKRLRINYFYNFSKETVIPLAKSPAA